MDYTQQLNDIRDSVQAQVGYQYQFATDLTVIRAEMEQTQEFILEDISGDRIITEKLERIEQTGGVIMLVGTLFLIYYFIMRCFR